LQEHGAALDEPQVVSASGLDARESRLTISGPGLPGEITIADRMILAALDAAQLENYAAVLGSPQVPAASTGYAITRYARERDGVYRPWDRLHYYPQLGGVRGAIFYDGLVNSPVPGLYDGKWFEPRPPAELVLRCQLAHLGVALDRPQALPVASTGNPPGEWLMGLGVALVVVGGLLRYRRWFSPSPAAAGEGR
jgi:hypothetical protein